MYVQAWMVDKTVTLFPDIGTITFDLFDYAPSVVG